MIGGLPSGNTEVTEPATSALGSSIFITSVPRFDKSLTGPGIRDVLSEVENVAGVQQTRTAVVLHFKPSRT